MSSTSRALTCPNRWLRSDLRFVPTGINDWSTIVDSINNTEALPEWNADHAAGGRAFRCARADGCLMLASPDDGAARRLEHLRQRHVHLIGEWATTIVTGVPTLTSSAPVGTGAT